MPPMNYLSSVPAYLLTGQSPVWNWCLMFLESLQSCLFADPFPSRPCTTELRATQL